VSRAGILQRDPKLVDAALAVAAAAAIVVTCWLSSGLSTPDRIVTAIAAVLYAAPIAVRRIWPAAALVFSTAVVTASTPLGGQLMSNTNAYIIPTLVLSYSAGERLEARRSSIALVVSLALAWTWALLPSSSGGGQSPAAVFFATMVLVPTWLIGRYVRRHRHRTASFNALAEQAAANREVHDAAAISAERARIGSELQDIIAHSISAMVIQAGSARLLLRSDPQRARASILTVEETGRQALSDLRRLLGMLRKDDDPRALSPQPGLSQIPALITSLEALGLDCQRHTVGTPVDLTPGIDLVAYRVVESALRAMAEAGVRRGDLTISYEARDLALEVRCDRALLDLNGTLERLTDRVALYHGQLGPASGADGSGLRARLPLDLVGAA
jgi:signal transduction histidine kinase